MKANKCISQIVKLLLQVASRSLTFHRALCFTNGIQKNIYSFLRQETFLAAILSFPKIEMCLCLSVFIASLLSTAVTVWLWCLSAFHHFPCLSLALHTKKAVTRTKREVAQLGCRSLLFSGQRAHPCLTITRLLQHFPSFLPSSLTPDWTNWWVAMGTRLFRAIKRWKSSSKESNQHSYLPAPLKDAVWWERNSWR